MRGGLFQSLAFSVDRTNKISFPINETKISLKGYFTNNIKYSITVFSLSSGNSCFFLLFCLQRKEVILYSYYSEIMLPTNKAPWGLFLRGRLFAKMSF